MDKKSCRNIEHCSLKSLHTDKESRFLEDLLSKVAKGIEGQSEGTHLLAEVMNSSCDARGCKYLKTFASNTVCSYQKLLLAYLNEHKDDYPQLYEQYLSAINKCVEPHYDFKKEEIIKFKK